MERTLLLKLVPLTDEAKEEMRWWLAHMESWNRMAIFGSMSDLVIESDASRTGWGARCSALSTDGKWSRSEQRLHINYLLLLAGSFAVRCWTRERAQCYVLKVDNASACKYINHLEGTKSRATADIAKGFWDFCLDQISVTAE